MNILFIAKDPPWPPMGGASLRAYHFIRALSQNHRVALVCYATVRQEIAMGHAPPDWQCSVHVIPPPSGKGSIERAILAFSGDIPDVVYRNTSPAMVQMVDSLLVAEDWDVVHLVGLEMASAMLPRHWTAFARGGPKIVLDAQNVEHRLQSQASTVARRKLSTWPAGAYSWLQSRKLKEYEAAVCRFAGGLITVSPEDRRALQDLLPGKQVTVVPNGVDTQRYCPDGPRNKRPHSRLLFTGTMDYRPNVDAAQWFARDVLPLIIGAAPSARFTIAGRNPTPSVCALAGPHVEVTGTVDDDLPYFRNTSVFVLPMRFGGGSRLKLLQAMACGLPVVTTTAGAAGIPVQHGKHIWIADAPKDFAGAVCRLLRDRETGRALGAAARELALEYDWRECTRLLESLYQTLVKQPVT